MTFGSTFGRVLSPTFHPKSQAAVAGGGWWDLNGTITSCVAAYQPKGAASYAASLTDLSGNSNDATEGTQPDWNSTNGWMFDGEDDYLKSNYVASPANSHTLIVRFSNAEAMGTTQGGIAGARSSVSTGNIWFAANTNYGVRYSLATSTQNQTPAISEGVLAVTANVGYRNGVADKTFTSSATNANSREIYIGIVNDYSALVYYIVYIQAIAIYNAALTSTQIGNLTTAMNAL
jgi:hypothetical protein